MHKRTRKRTHHYWVFSLTGIFIFFAVYSPVYIYLQEKHHLHSNIIPREVILQTVQVKGTVHGREKKRDKIEIERIGEDIIQVPGWERNVSRDTCNIENKMSKIQTKISFLEKKKTSARLQEKFKKNGIKQNSKDKTEIIEVEDKSCDKENELKVKLLCRKNPTVLIYRSPIKSVKTKLILNKSEIPEIRGNDCEINDKSTNINEDVLNDLELSVSQITGQASNLSRSPLKEKTIGSTTPLKQRFPFNHGKSPIKKESTNSPNDVRKENYELSVKRSPLKRGSPNKNTIKDDESSPPKQKCIQEETPSHLLTKLALESPEKKLDLKSRKELFPKGEFDQACKALHSSAPVKLPGREDKLDFIKEFLIKHSDEQSSGTLYISGPPGTGKTASINLAISDPKIAEQYKVICLNCTSVTSCGSIYSRIVGELKLKVLGHSEKAALTAIEKHFESMKRKMILIVLDELDQLCSTKQSVLYSVFEWPAKKNARLVLIGIANALDLTDRVLPRLQAHLALQPTVLHFPSYTRQQIIDIIADRLTQAGVEAVFSGPTLQLLAGKVAAVNGDVRRALDIARRVVELAEKRSELQPIPDAGSRRQTVALQEVMTVINDVYNTAPSLDSSESDSFPLQQKLLICSLLLIRQTSKTKDVTIGKLHEVYKKVCERRNMSALDMSEFVSLMPLVEARGILRVKGATGKNNNRQSKVILQWDEGEVKNALRDKQLLAAVLSDKGIV